MMKVVAAFVALKVKKEVDQLLGDSEEKVTLHMWSVGVCVCVRHQATVTKGIAFHQNTGAVKWEYKITDCSFTRREYKTTSSDYKLLT